MLHVGRHDWKAAFLQKRDVSENGILQGFQMQVTDHCHHQTPNQAHDKPGSGSSECNQELFGTRGKSFEGGDT